MVDVDLFGVLELVLTYLSRVDKCFFVIRTCLSGQNR